MSLRKIVKEGDEVLTKVCFPVEKFDKKLKDLISDLIETLDDAEGLGLAAPQIGVARRAVIVIDEDDETHLTLINPVITEKSGEQEYTEGCLSVPHIWGVTKRPQKVTVKYQDEDGNEKTLTREGRTAVCICHELDHLDGVLFRERVIKYIPEEELYGEN